LAFLTLFKRPKRLLFDAEDFFPEGDFFAVFDLLDFFPDLALLTCPPE
jgi:hypothetical protein